MQSSRFFSRVALAIFAGAMLFASGCSKSPAEEDKAATWVEYRNPDQGVMFTHPNTWEVSIGRRTGPGGSRSVVFSLDRKRKDGQTRIFDLMVLKRSEHSGPLEQVFAQTYRRMFTSSASMRKVTTKSGATALIWNDDSGSLHYDHAVVESGDKIFVIDAPFAQERDFLDRILDTLRAI
jgi:hypothetical protein